MQRITKLHKQNATFGWFLFTTVYEYRISEMRGGR